MKYSALPRTENPNFRIRDLGGKALTDAELLAVALRINETEAAEALRNLLTEYGSLARIPSEKITGIKGLGEGYANSVAAISELVNREVRRTAPEQARVNSPTDAAALVQYEMSALDHEELWVMLLDTRNNVKKICKVYQGSVNSCQVRVGDLFKAAVRENAPALIVFHNHPSGDPTPSPDDVAVTRAINQAGKLMDVDVLDHVVIGAGRWVSLKERGLGFN
jgi:DNA repair protein RadC